MPCQVPHVFTALHRPTPEVKRRRHGQSTSDGMRSRALSYTAGLLATILLCIARAVSVAAAPSDRVTELAASRSIDLIGRVATSRCGSVRTQLSFKEGNFFYFSEVTASRVSCTTAVRVDEAIIARYCAHSIDDYCGPPTGRETVLGWQCHTPHANRLSVVCTKARAKIISVVESGGGD
jgi:hypothetical protein